MTLIDFNGCIKEIKYFLKKLFKGAIQYALGYTVPKLTKWVFSQNEYSNNEIDLIIQNIKPIQSSKYQIAWLEAQKK